MKLQQLLLAWYDKHARELPWRTSPAERRSGIQPDPYVVWLSEIMLQQTTVATVGPYFKAFLSEWPDVKRLAAASEDAVLSRWAGLGYYSRARNLKACADEIVREHGGKFPRDVEALLDLPGIGPYTAAAIAAIASDVPVAVVDGNVERVFSRLEAIDTPLPKAKSEIKAAVEKELPVDRPGDFAQACMDLGATICSPKNPSCNRCPIASFCNVFKNGLNPHLFPVKPAKTKKPTRLGAAYVLINKKGEILLEKRPPSGLLASMTQVPTTGWSARQDGLTGLAGAPAKADWRAHGIITHTFTHFHLRLEVFSAFEEIAPGERQMWVPISAIDAQALPTVMKKVVAAAL